MNDPRISVVTLQNFAQEVLEASQKIPVVIDFWASWCQPCLLLAPILERVVQGYGGRVKAVKVDTEAEQSLAGQFGISSLPTLVLLKAGKVGDQATGLLSEDQLRTWLDYHVPSEADLLANEALAMETTEPDRAEVQFRLALERDAQHPPSHAGLGRIALASGRIEEAHYHVEKLVARGILEPEGESLKARLELADRVAKLGHPDAVIDRARQDPEDCQALLNLAILNASNSDRAHDALRVAFQLVENDHGLIRDEARQLMLLLFRILPDQDPQVGEYRRKLSTALF